MARITDVSFALGSNRYNLALDFDDAALVGDKVAFDVTATCTHGAPTNLQVKVRVEIEPAKRTIKVLINDQVVLDLDGFNTESSTVEKLLDTIPGALLGDPVTACAVKAGVSAIINQALLCFRSLEDGGAWAKLPAFFTCMGKNFGRISKLAMYRAFKCIGGF